MNEINLRFICFPTIKVDLLKSISLKQIIIEQQATSDIPSDFHDLFPQETTTDILDEQGNVIDTVIMPKTQTLKTEDLLKYKRDWGYHYRRLKQIFLKNNKVLVNILEAYNEDTDSIVLHSVKAPELEYEAILFRSKADFRLCYNKFGVSVNKEGKIIIFTTDRKLEKATLNNFLRSNEAQLLAAFTDEYYKAYALKDGYYLVVHYDREKPSTSLFNDYEAFKDYVAILPPLV